MVERQTARKVRIKDIVNGRWVKKEGMEPSYSITFYSEKVSRVELTGTVVAKFTSENENFRTVTVDDSTETIRIKAFRPIEVSSNDPSEANRIEKAMKSFDILNKVNTCLLYTSPSPRDRTRSRMPSSA